MKTLIIVESPTKANTIKNYLPEDYEVFASVGHIRDLATSGVGGYGVDFKNNFKPSYKLISKKYNTVKELKQLAKDKNVLIATDPDREGEAIAWHLADVLGLDLTLNNRIRFNEITKKAILESLKNPTKIDMDLVSSQETRRILDRIIGFDLSKLVQRKLRSTSAGRVQSVALKMIYERENEINNFIKEPYYLIFAEFDCFKADYTLNNKPINLKEEALEVMDNISNDFLVKEVDVSEQKRYSRYPYTTSSLQQDGINRLKMSASSVMVVAQKLYEGINIDEQTVGLITYMRTDSTRLSPTFIKDARSFITQKYGKQYVGTVRKRSGSKQAQDAHEAIRPTDINLTPEKVKPYLDNRSYRLYNMIYNRTLAFLMKEGVDEVKKVTLDSNKYLFKSTFSRIIFDGYRVIYLEDKPTECEFNNKVGDTLKSKKNYLEEKWTEPPRRYTEASLINQMEKEGIGRPSTYAETTRRISAVGYAKRVKGSFVPTEQGMLTASNLKDFFPTLINTNYTSKMEQQLDLVAEGKEDKNQILLDFYQAFKPLIDTANKKMPRQIIKKEVIEVGEACPECGKPLVYRKNKKGETFIGCSGFPKCKYTRNVDE